MENLLLTIYSNNEKSLNNFYFVLKTLFKNKLICLLKTNELPSTKKITSILKSPHVNKTAQEQFEEKLFTLKITILTKKSYKTLIVLKKFLKKLFNDLKINVRHITSKELNRNISEKFFKKTNFKTIILNKTCLNKTTQTFEHNHKNFSSQKRYKLFKIHSNILNNFGEVQLLDKISLNSSAVEHRTENP